jgi:hypothetical protein
LRSFNMALLFSECDFRALALRLVLRSLQSTKSSYARSVSRTERPTGKLTLELMAPADDRPLGFGNTTKKTTALSVKVLADEIASAQNDHKLAGQDFAGTDGSQ